MTPRFLQKMAAGGAFALMTRRLTTLLAQPNRTRAQQGQLVGLIVLDLVIAVFAFGLVGLVGWTMVRTGDVDLPLLVVTALLAVAGGVWGTIGIGALIGLGGRDHLTR
ncbi:hypothetical protein [Lacticaseibacillus daqingensis]|uniref:hypothetical protein n=1 Tax=Lacticaseibacillus daqingensis TaxID=2486014 RepID=UPI000F7675AC|nr:hypothetical protein [Lacticaseibacillus daqingensis]